ncbi:MAG: hypothetical protein ACR2PQ_00340, partial [Myxococcota bacterium]
MKLALLFFAIYALPLFWPPGPVLPDASVADASLWARLFPEVSSWWIAIRLAALAAAVGLAFREVALPTFASVGAPTPGVVGPRARIAAWLLAIVALALSFVASRFGGALDLPYILSLAAPCVALAVGTPRGRADGSLLRSGWFVGCAVLVACWAVWRGFDLWHSPRAADVVDTWLGFAELVCVAYHG